MSFVCMQTYTRGLRIHFPAKSVEVCAMQMMCLIIICGEAVLHELIHMNIHMQYSTRNFSEGNTAHFTYGTCDTVNCGSGRVTCSLKGPTFLFT